MTLTEAFVSAIKVGGAILGLFGVPLFAIVFLSEWAKGCGLKGAVACYILILAIVVFMLTGFIWVFGDTLGSNDPS